VATLLLAAAADAARAAVGVRAQLDRSQASAGETVGLDVTVSGAGGGIAAPDLALPAGLEVVGTSRMENFSWVNGRSSSEIVFHFDLAVQQAGRYTIGPVRVPVGRQVFSSAALSLIATAGPPAVASAPGVASLLVEIEPREPWVGEPVVLRVRLVLARDLAEEPAYVPPMTTGFWAETASRPESYYALQAGRRVLVTETRTRLYPLAPGVARIGPAGATILMQEGGPAGPLGWIAGAGPQRELTLRSQPLLVPVRPLPAGAPPGFDGAVGSFSVSWSADRTRTSQDVPVAVRLDVRGTGNLPLVKAPVLTSSDGEVFAGTADDSLPALGVIARGRRRFQWNVLPQRPGALSIAPPAFAWFDPAARAYRHATLAPLGVEVGPPLFSSSHEREAFPGALLRDAPDPFARGVAPWAWALAGLLAGAAVVLWRARPAPDPRATERTQLAGWRNALRAPGGAAFWRAAEEACDWLERAGRPVEEVRAQVVATRYGGGEADVSAVRLRLSKELSGVLPAAPRRWISRPVAVVLAAVAAIVLALSLAGLGESAGAVRLRAGDRAARDGDVARARAAWLGMWREGARAPALAARIAWAELTRGAPGPAAQWVLRGERWGARDPALAWVSDLVREGGGLAGERPVRLPIRRGEWAVLALALGIGAGACWPRRALVATLAALALAAAAVEPVQDVWATHVAQAVIARSVPLERTGLELETGQVVQVLGREGDLARVRAGRDLNGRLRWSDLLPVEETR
jgi:hypothetical protein